MDLEKAYRQVPGANNGTREDQLVFTPVDLSTLRSFGVDNIQIMLHPAIQVFDAIKELLVMEAQTVSTIVSLYDRIFPQTHQYSKGGVK